MTITSPPPVAVPAVRLGLAVGQPRLVGAALESFGAARPVGVHTGDQVSAPFGKSGSWVEQRTGIRELRRLADGESLPALALGAARDALDPSRNAHHPSRDALDRSRDIAPVDLIIAASCSIRADEPPLAPALAAALAPTAATMDLNAACAGFCYSLAAAQAAIATGSAHRVLIVGAEQMSRLVNPADLGTSIIFGDGAGAAVVRAVEPGAPVAIGPVVWGSDGAAADAIDMPDGRFMRMQGQAVFRWAVDEMHHVAAAACDRAGIGVQDVDVFVPHQANLRIVEAMARRLGVRGVVADSVRTTGNTSAASIPLALRELAAPHRGGLALLIGFGAGLCYAAQVVRLP